MKGKLQRSNHVYKTTVEPIDSVMPMVVLVNEICGLRCDHPAAAASFFRKSVRVQPDAGEACAGEQQPGFGLQPDGL